MLPKEISPNPLVTSTIELRYVANYPADEIFPLIYPLVLGELPQLDTSKHIPREIRDQDPRLINAPDYILRNEKYLMSFSERIISFENTAEYSLWKNYFPFITSKLEIFYKNGIIKSIDRIGLRYGSVFDGVFDIHEVLRHVPSSTSINENEQFVSFSCFKGVENNISLFLQMHSRIEATKNNKTRSGVYIDIDASTTEIKQSFEDVINTIDNLHKTEKETFFGLLKTEFIESLNPKY